MAVVSGNTFRFVGAIALHGLFTFEKFASGAEITVTTLGAGSSASLKARSYRGL
jgi:hypothetical protein